MKVANRVKFSSFAHHYTGMKKVLFLIFGVCMALAADAATRYSYNNGGSVGWSSTDPALGPVTPASTPGTGDNIIITNQIPVTFGARDITSGGSILVRSGATLTFTGNLGVRNGGTLTVSGILNATNMTVYGGNPGGGFTVNSGGDVNVSGNFTNNNNSDGVTINGSLDVAGNLTNGNNSDIVGTGGITVGGSISNSGTIGGSTGNNLGTLPVELTYFEVLKSPSGLELKWQTATELNNDFFEIQRSENGTDFYVIGVVNGNGTTNTVQNYQFGDTPMQPVTYYRLRQVDYDGAFEYSKIKVGYADKLATSLKILAYPNPAIERVSFKSVQPIVFEKLQLINLNGHVVANLTNSVEGYGLTLDVALPRLEKGLYYIQYATQSGEKGAHKLVIK
jgi:hypothetical protein